jgi:putative CocE/NonD family hydrolase
VRIVSESAGVHVETDVPVVMRDGTTLRADVYTPAGGGPFPCVLYRTPYGKTGRFGPGPLADTIASRGYIVVIQDTRGRFASDGDFAPLYARDGRSDADDGFDTVQWAATLPNCTGQVGVLGSSYPAALAWELAPTRPPALAAMCVHGMVGDSRSVSPGVIRLSMSLPWHMLDFATDLHVRSGKHEGPLDLDDAYRLWEFEHGKWLWYLPLAQIPDSRLGSVGPYWRHWLAHQQYDTFSHHSRCRSIEVPIYHVGGWYDPFVQGIDLYTTMAEHAPKEEARRSQKLLVGPWTHDGIGASRVGDLDFGPEAETTFADEASRWFDHWLKGGDNVVDEELPVKLFVMGANRWRTEREWPLARAELTTLFLRSGGKANTPAGDGRLAREARAEEPADSFVYDPRDPVPTLFSGPYAYGAPFDQRVLDHRRDVLVYQSDPLEQGIEVTGSVEVALFASSSALDTDWTAKLVDVYPDGRAFNISYSLVRARYRESFEAPSLLEPDRVYEYRLRLHPTSNLFRPGHRIRVDISSSDFPNYDRNHNTGGNDWQEVELRAARQRVFHDANRASRLRLPVIRS